MNAPRREIQCAGIGHERGIGVPAGRPLVVPAPGQAGDEALLVQEDAERVDADLLAAFGQVGLDLVDREVLLAEADHQVAYGVSPLGRMRAVAHVLEEALLAGGVVAELRAEDAERPGRVAEAGSDLLGGQLVDEVSAERLVLAVEWLLRYQKEAGLVR